MRIDSSGKVGIGYVPESVHGNFNTIITGASTARFHLGYGTNGDNYYTSGSNGIHVFRSDTTERMRIDSSGNVGINATPENSSGTWRNFNFGSLSMAGRSNNSNPDAIIGTNFKFTTANAEQRISAHAASRLFFNDDVITFENVGADSAGSNITWSERMRITSDGVIQNNGLTTTQSSAVRFSNDGFTWGMIIEDDQVSNGLILFSAQNGDSVGSITRSGLSTSYNTSSDYRLKENVVEMTGALDRVSQLKPSRFNFIGEEKIVDGFLAHEVSDIVPEAITGTKDEMRTEEYEETPAVYEEVIHEAQEAIEWTDKPTMDNTKVEIQEWLDDNNIEWQSADTKQELLDRIPEYQQEAQEEWTESVLVSEAVMATREVPVYQGIDQSKLVPLLVGAIQELKAEIETLKQQINN